MQLKVNDLKIKLMSKRMLDKSATFFNGLMRCIFTWLVLFATFQVNAQGWDILFGGAGEDQAYSVIQTKDHGYITAGFSQSFSGNDPFLILMYMLFARMSMVHPSGRKLTAKVLQRTSTITDIRF